MPSTSTRECTLVMPPSTFKGRKLLSNALLVHGRNLLSRLIINILTNDIKFLHNTIGRNNGIEGGIATIITIFTKETRAGECDKEPSLSKYYHQGQKKMEPH